jgi:hypothetical protein
MMSQAEDVTIDCAAEMTANAGSGTFAPYYIASNRHGVLSQSRGAMLRLSALKQMDKSRRFSWGVGVDAIAATASHTDYARYDVNSATWYNHSEGIAPIRLQQLYGELKWRSLFLTVGMKQHESALLNFELSSGDLTESGNARPIPEVRVGLIDFRDIPLTNGWLQIQGELSYGKMTDNKWLLEHYNYYNYHITQGTWYNYKRIYFRTKPTERFSVTLGMQAAGQFAGNVSWYRDGIVYQTLSQSFKIKYLWKMLIPQSDGVYYAGNHLGSWDFLARYRLKSGDEVRVYFQWPWEDGSGIGKLNGFDGLWGLEWRSAQRRWITGVVAEYLYFMNQSGPIHYSPGDTPNSTIPAHTDGGDQYYNNQQYNGYANYGMSIGSPFLPSPIYNQDGYMAYIDNRVRGFHIGLSGAMSRVIDWRLLASYRQGFGDGRIPRQYPVHNTSLMAEARWHISTVPGLSVCGQIAIDRGDIYGNNCGALLSVKYDCSFMFNRPNRK